MTPTNEMRKRKTPQNMMPPMMLVVSTLVDMAYTATVIRMIDKSFFNKKKVNICSCVMTVLSVDNKIKFLK